jgi:predicted transcriptional regulator
MDTQTSQELVEFFKTLGDATRLKIVGLLAQREMTVEELAAALNLQSSTMSHHLARLSRAGLVSARAESYYNYYRLETAVLEDMSRRLLSQETLRQVAENTDLDAYDQKIVKNFTYPDGRIKQFPAQLKKMTAILRYVVQAFEPGVRYSEKQVNERLARYHDDTATLRRELVDLGFMARESGGREYWLLDRNPDER